MQYTIINLLRDPGTYPYLETGMKLKVFRTKSEAFEAAVSAAENEASGLNDGHNEGISFGVEEGSEGYQNRDEVVLNCYSHEDDNTEMVTARYIVPLEERLIPGDYYDADGDRLPDTPVLDKSCLSLAENLILDYPNNEWNDASVLTLAAFLKRNRYAWLDPVRNLGDDFMCGAEADDEPDMAETQEAVENILHSLDNCYAILQLREGEEHHYETIYVGEFSDSADNKLENTDILLEDIYEKFNLEHPEGFTGHSLSVGDIVALKINGTISYHFTDPIGFTELVD